MSKKCANCGHKKSEHNSEPNEIFCYVNNCSCNEYVKPKKEKTVPSVENVCVCGHLAESHGQSEHSDACKVSDCPCDSYTQASVNMPAEPDPVQQQKYKVEIFSELELGHVIAVHILTAYKIIIQKGK